VPPAHQDNERTEQRPGGVGCDVAEGGLPLVQREELDCFDSARGKQACHAAEPPAAHWQQRCYEQSQRNEKHHVGGCLDVTCTDSCRQRLVLKEQQNAAIETRNGALYRRGPETNARQAPEVNG